MKLFKNRETAGKLLVEKLKDLKVEDVCVLALPRGGVPVAWEVSKALNLPLDVILVKKISAPDQPEFAIGAVSEDEHPIWNQESISMLGLSKKDLRPLAEKSHKKISEQMKKWRHGRKPLNIKNKTVILVDDGLATGLTMLAAVEFLKRREVKAIILAVPVSSRSAVDLVKSQVHQVIALQTPEPFFSVGQWYEDFTQVSDEIVTQLLMGKKTIDESVLAVKISTQSVELNGDLTVPNRAKAIIVFAHGSGSSRKSPRNQRVAQFLNERGFATLLFDLLTDKEAQHRPNVFNISLLSERLQLATDWIRREPTLEKMPIGYFGASTGAAAALVAAAKDKNIFSVVSRGGRPDLAEKSLDQVLAPVLLIVGGEDHDVIDLNKKAQNHLKMCELVIVPKAGHLFEESGTLEKVMEHAAEWFSRTLLEKKESVAEIITHLSNPFNSQEQLAPLIRKLSESRVVMLGEATHGTEEFYNLRKIISQKLIEDYGFNFIAVEGDWPDCYRLNQYINKGEGTSARVVMKNYQRWPTWMWANEQVADLVDWMKGKNVGFYGLDVYSLYESLDSVKAHVKKIDPAAKARILEAYSCLDSFDRNEMAYAKSLVKWPQGCEKEILHNLNQILRLRLEQTALEDEELFDARQNAKIIKNAEKYYRAMMMGGAESWNIRDEHMMDTLDSLLRYYGEGAKGIVWAHNTHVGDYHATDMVTEGYINLGGLARERYGIENVALVGFGTYQGKVLAGRAWEAQPEIMELPSAAADTYEDYFHKAAKELHSDQLYLFLKGEKALSVRKGHRAVGVVYQTQFEAQGRNYVPTELAQRYDAFIFIDKTTSLKALPGVTEKGILPETWPSGV